MPRSARCASVFHTFWPLTIHSSPSRTARVASPARSEPAPGSEKSWHQISSPVNIGRSARRRSSSLPCVTTVGPASDSPKNNVPCAAGTPASRRRRSTWRCMRGAQPESAEAFGEVHPRQPAVVLRAAERELVGGARVVRRRAGRRSSAIDAGEVVGHRPRALRYFVGGDPAVDGDDRAGHVRAGPAREVDRRRRPCRRGGRCDRAATSARSSRRSCFSVSAIIFDSNGPGAIAFTVMWRGPSWRARWRVS